MYWMLFWAIVGGVIGFVIGRLHRAIETKNNGKCKASSEVELDTTLEPFKGTCPSCHQQKYHMKGCWMVTL